MPPRLPPVLSGRDLPIAELSAARLDGELFPVAGAFAPIDEVDGPRLRARALGTGIHDRLIAEQFSAAWIWGALASPPARHQFCAAIGARVSRTIVPWCTVREVVIDEAAVVTIDGIAVTTPLRTVVDLARFSPTFGSTERAVVSSLLVFGGLTVHDALRDMDARRNLPGKREAARRLTSSGVLNPN